MSAHRLKAYISNPLLSDKAAAAAAAAAATSPADAEEEPSDLDQEKNKMHSPQKKILPDNNDDIVVLSHQDAVHRHRPIPLKSEKNITRSFKTEPVSPPSTHSSLEEQTDQSSTAGSDLAQFQVSPSNDDGAVASTRSRSALHRMGSQIFGKKSGFVPNLDDVSEFLSPPQPSRVTRKAAKSKNIEVPPIWPLPPATSSKKDPTKSGK